MLGPRSAAGSAGARTGRSRDAFALCPVSTVRYGYPSAFGFPVRLFNLKRCLLEAEFVTRGGDTVWIGNTHNTAYDTGGMRSDEMRFLGELLRGLSPGRSLRDGRRLESVSARLRAFRRKSCRTAFSSLRRSTPSLIGPGFRFAYDPVKADAALSGPAL